MNGKIALISLSHRELDSPMPPLGLLYLSAVAEEEKFEVGIFDFGVDEEMRILNSLKEFNPDIIGITILTHVVNEAKKVIQFCRENLPKAKIVVGGPHVTVRPIDGLKYCNADIVVVGEGEEAFKELLLKYKIDGLNNYGGIVNNQKILDLEKVPLPARHLIDYKRYKYTDNDGDVIHTLTTSRGCPGKCIFCCIRVFGNRTRYFPIDKTLSEIEYLIKKCNAKSLYFQDDCFTSDLEYVRRICNIIISKKYNIKFRCRARIKDFYKPESLGLLSLMKKAGCDKMIFGIESGNQSILNSIKKGITIQQIEKTVQHVKDSGIKVKASFILGLPNDNHDTINDTLSLAFELGLDEVQFTLATPLPGTELWEIAKLDNQIADNENLYDDAIIYRYDLNNQKKLVANVSDLTDEELLSYLKKAREYDYMLRVKNNIYKGGIKAHKLIKK